MKIGEFFVSLGIKGTDKVGKALKQTTSGIKDMANTSIETKAAIVGLIYGLERMMSFSTQLGASLKNFSVYTGMSAQELQKWQYAARKVNVTNEDVEASFKNVQKAMGNIMLGKGAPEGFAMLVKATNLDTSRLEDTVYMMGKIQDFLVNTKASPTLANTIAGSMGLSESMLTAMKQGAFTAQKMASAPTLSQHQVDTLSKMNAKMAEFWNNMQMTMAVFIEKHFPQIVEFLDKISNAIKDFAFGKGAEESFKTMLKIAQDISKALGIAADAVGTIQRGHTGLMNLQKSIVTEGANATIGAMSWLGLLKPKAPSIAESKSGANINVNQNIEFVGGSQTENKAMADDFKKIMEKTFFQMPLGAQN